MALEGTTSTQLAAKARVPTRPEVELMLCCATTCRGGETSERIKALLKEDIDWIYLIETAASHGLKPLLYWNLNANCPEAVPKATLSQLQDDFSVNANRNEFLFDELLKLLNLFEEFDIRAIPFKGPVLAISVYGNLELRQFYDLDILVRKQDFLKAKELLISQGYKLRESFGFEESYVNYSNGIDVDLHQEIVEKGYRFQPDFERLLRNLVPVSHAGATVACFSSEDLVMVLSVQITKDFSQNKRSIKQLCDLAELICVHKEIDWGQVIKQARALHSERMLLLSLFLANELIGSVLPEEIRRRIKADPMVRSLAAEVIEELFYQADNPSLLERRLHFYSFTLRLKERMQDRIFMFCILSLSYLKYRIRPNYKDRALLPLPRPLYFLYYLVRPVRLVGKYGVIILKRCTLKISRNSNN